MNFFLTEEQQAVQEAARDFAQTHLLPGVIERDEHQKFPTEQVKMMAELGFMGITASPDYGGSGMDHLCYALAIKELSKIDASAGVIMSAHNSLAIWGIDTYGTHEQKLKYLVPLATGKSIGAFCLSEPNAGSDASSQKTSAIDKGSHYLLNGVKNWITNGGTADYYVVIAQTDVEKKHKGINAFIVEKSWAGVTVGQKENKLGIRSSDTHQILFQDVEVPKENRIGEDGFGFRLAMEILDGGRIGIAAQALGIAEGGMEFAMKYAQERETFGKPIFKHQLIQSKFAEMATDIEAAKLLTLQAAFLKDQKRNYTKEAAMAKFFASKNAMKHAVEAVQIHGGYGFVKEFHVERLMRDAKITEIYEGTSEIQQLVIARELFGG
jgi:alkylation response protein AidB-like acyl-CoA dehydrogenase